MPPIPGRMPSDTSGKPKVAFSAAIRMSQARATSQPPPRAKPLTAAIVGTGLRSSRAIAACPISEKRFASIGSIPLIAVMSAPAINGPLPGAGHHDHARSLGLQFQ